MQRHTTLLNQLIKQKIFEENYLQRLDGTHKDKVYEGDVERITHGVMHACRVAILTNVLVNMLRECGSKEAAQLTNDDIKYLQIAAFFHDAARKGEGKDTWEAESAEKCRQFLSSIGLDETKAYYYSNMILTKELSIAKNDKLGLLRSILQSADSLDIMRCKKKFDIKKSAYSKNLPNLTTHLH
jgi:hypothetical protein